jgi:hypothetical protein
VSLRILVMDDEGGEAARLIDTGFGSGYKLAAGDEA